MGGEKDKRIILKLKFFQLLERYLMICNFNEQGGRGDSLL